MVEQFGIVCFLSVNKDKKQEQLSENNYKEIIWKYIKNICKVSISAQIMILPIMVYNYHTMSLTFFITNVLTSCLIGLIIIFGFLLILISFPFLRIAIVFGKIYKLLIDFLLLITEHIAKTPFAKIYIKTPYFWEIVMYYILVFAFIFLYHKFGKNFLIQKIKKIAKAQYKKIIAIILVISIFFAFIKIIPKDLKIYFIDVGQGDSCLIITPQDKKILIDGGGSETYDVGEQVLLPYLLNRRINKIDYIVCSHFDTDHVGGILTVMEELKVGTVIITKQKEDSENYERFKEIVKDKKINVLVVGTTSSHPQTIQIEKDLYLDILWPENSNLISENVLNNNSIVCKLHYINFSMLFTGDIEEIAEKKILQTYRDDVQILKSTVLKVAHHGSKTSSINELLKAINPKIALIGVGKNNSFGHPNDMVLERLENLRCKNLSHRPRWRNIDYCK